MSKLTEAAKNLNPVLSTLAEQVGAIAQRQRVRKTVQAETLANAKAVASVILDFVSALEGKGGTTTGVTTVSVQPTTPSPVTHVPFTPNALTPFQASNTAGLTVLKGQKAVNLLVELPTGRAGQFTLATGETFYAAKWTRGTLTNLGNGFCVLPVLYRFLNHPRVATDAQAVLNRLAI